MAVAFGLAAAALAVAAVSQAVLPGPAVTAAVSGLLLTVAVAYLLSRTVGIPGLTGHREPFDALGSTLSSLQLGAAALALLPITRRSS